MVENDSRKGKRERRSLLEEIANFGNSLHRQMGEENFITALLLLDNNNLIPRNNGKELDLRAAYAFIALYIEERCKKEEGKENSSARNLISYLKSKGYEEKK